MDGRQRDRVERGLLRALLRDAVRLVLPVECPGCGAWDETLCARCGAALDGPVRRCEDDVPRLDRMDGRPPLPVWAAARYAGSTRGVVVGWKDRGRLDLTPRLAGAVRRAATEAAVLLGPAAGGGVLHVVPVPSSGAARRRRGADLVGRLAVGCAQGLQDAGAPAVVRPALARRSGRRDQVGLGARARSSNSAGSWRLRRGTSGLGGSAGEAGRHVVLVDDVVTTGSTLAACEVVMSASGALVLGAVVLAATPSRSGDLQVLPAGPLGD